MKWYLLVVLMSSQLWAQEDIQETIDKKENLQQELEAVGEEFESEPAVEEIKEEIKETAKEENELLEEKTKIDPVLDPKKWGVYGTFSYVDTWVPGKFGLTATYGDEERTYELAWQQASFSVNILIDDLGGVSDRRIHLTTRSFVSGRSFNFQYGAFYNTVTAELGNSYTETVGASFDVIRVDTAGVMWGLGNRWKWENGFAVGFDWFKVFWPLAIVNKEADFLDETDDSDDKDEVETLIDGVASLPTFSLLHFELGYRF
ncbi:MAG: hypothetical protein CME62_14140 [Halobacteriovoraceae bacterium]|nr:hypothetical protein [Halobacteriovoraceae bacterium]|tara:strand:+ start:1110 stop:1889 length:780 start_codon:yes stop_codon:yes gene_type:complete